MASYKIDTAWNSGVDKPSTLKVSAGNGYYDGAGAYHLDGQVSNVGLITAKAVVVSAALYDNEGKVAGAGYAFTVPAQLAAGSTAPFHIVYDQTAGSPVTYSINVQSNEFSSVMDLQQSMQESSPAQQATIIAVGLDMPSYHYADTVHATGNVSSLVAGESLVTIELLYPDGSALNSVQVPLIKNSYFASFDIVASSEFDGKTFTVRATYAASSTAASLKYLGSETPQPVKQDVKQNNARLSMSASLNDQKVMILTIKNPNGSGATVYGMNVKVDKGSIKSATGTAGWKAKVDGSLAKFTTIKPVIAGKIANFKLKMSDIVHAISWSVVDKDGHVIHSSTAVVKARK